MSSRLNPSAVCVRSLVPNEKKSASRAMSIGDQARPRQLDHRPDRRVLRRSVLVLATFDQLPHQLELALVGDEGIIISTGASRHAGGRREQTP